MVLQTVAFFPHLLPILTSSSQQLGHPFQQHLLVVKKQFIAVSATFPLMTLPLNACLLLAWLISLCVRRALLFCEDLILLAVLCNILSRMYSRACALHTLSFYKWKTRKHAFQLMAEEISFHYDEILEQGPVFAPVQTTAMSNRRLRFSAFQTGVSNCCPRGLRASTFYGNFFHRQMIYTWGFNNYGWSLLSHLIFSTVPWGAHV